MADLQALQADTGIPLVSIFQHMDELSDDYSSEPSQVREGPNLATLPYQNLRLYGNADGWYRYPYGSDEVTYLGVKHGMPRVKLEYNQGQLATVDEYGVTVLNTAPPGSLWWNDQFYPVQNKYWYWPTTGRQFQTYVYFTPGQVHREYGVQFGANQIRVDHLAEPAEYYEWSGQ